MADPLSLGRFYCSERNQFLYLIFFVIAAGVVPCDSPKKGPRTTYIVQFIF